MIATIMAGTLQPTGNSPGRPQIGTRTMGSGNSTTTTPAVQFAGMRAPEERTERSELRPTATPRSERPRRAARSLAILGRTLVRLIEQVIAWHRCRHDRQLLASLDDRRLRDIGIDGPTTESDSVMSFWRLH